MVEDPLASVVTATYRSGSWVAVAASRLWLVIQASAGDPWVVDAWTRAERGAGLLELVQFLVGGGPGGPNFAMVSASQAGVRVVVTRGASAEVVAGEMKETLHCPGAAAVAEYLVAEPEFIRIAGEDGSMAPALPISSGIVAASELTVAWGRQQISPALPVPVVLSIEESATAPDLASPTDSVATAQEGRVDDPDPNATIHADTSCGDQVSEMTLTGVAEQIPALTVTATSPDDEGATVEEEVQNDAYSFLFGHTIRRSVEYAAVREPEDDHAGAVEATSPPNAPAVRAPEPEAVVPTSATEPPPRTGMTAVPTGGLIDSVPGSRPRPAEPTPPVAPAPGPSNRHDNDGDGDLTVSRAMLMRHMQTPGSLNPNAPTVHAVRCSDQHPNPANADRCRVCGISITDRSPTTVPRPALGTLRFSTGVQVTLDRGVLLGRGPSSNHLVGGERPHVVKLPSPSHDISREHLEVRLDGWHVLVTDLRSTNGTRVTLPGRDSERLRPDEPMMIQPGTEVNIADEITFVFEVLP